MVQSILGKRRVEIQVYAAIAAWVSQLSQGGGISGYTSYNS